MRVAIVTARVIYRDGRSRVRTFRALDWTIADLRAWIVSTRGGTWKHGTRRPVPAAWPIVRAIVRGGRHRNGYGGTL